MSNSVVKVTDTTDNDCLLLLVGEDGTVTPSKDVVDAYLGLKTGATNLQVMHINKADDQAIEVSVNDMLYLPETECESVEETQFDEIAYNLYNVRLDHDYTSQCESLEEVDELAQTLSILDGDAESLDDSFLKISTDESNIEKLDPKVGTSISGHTNSTIKTKKTTTYTSPSTKTGLKKIKLKNTSEKDDRSNQEEDECDPLDGENINKLKGIKKLQKVDLKSKDIKILKQADVAKIDKSQATSLEQKFTDKKLLKKDKKVTKSVPDDFALFSTPDIIRRVGGKDPAVLNYPTTSPPEPFVDTKPAKIEIRSKSVSECPSKSKKTDRLSLDGKIIDRQFVKMECKLKDKKVNTRQSTIDYSSKKNSEPFKTGAEIHRSINLGAAGNVNVLTNSEGKHFASSSTMESDTCSTEQNITLDANSLDLDPALLDNINNDLISEDILYQVAQSLVSNTELQNAIDKSLNEENLELPASVQEVLDSKPMLIQHTVSEQVTSSTKGTQIVRPDGRIVVIPPIERPTTRSRNKKSSEDTTPKISRKPLDEEHVSGNEFDSSGEEEEESEDDPNKLWCICNQPHNNRFMICCDTCEEWYHGKCVNITKAMGQQMESEGREWICLFCKDPLLKRPQAAQRRIRKASRHSRQSSDSSSSVKVSEVKSVSVPCVVCHKPSRTNSIFCSEACILIHAQGVERVVVFERATGNMLTGSKAPSAANLEQWLKDHPGYEVVRSAGKIVTTKHTHQVAQPKLNALKNSGTDVDVISNKNKTFGGGAKGLSKSHHQIVKVYKGNAPGSKIVDKQFMSPQKSNTFPINRELTSPPSKFKVTSSSLKANISSGSKEKSSSVKLQKVRHSEPTVSGSTHTKQENIRENVQKTIFEQLTNRLKMADDINLSEQELKDISTEIESQLYKCFGDTGQKYRNKYRSLIFNIKDVKNQTLWRRICEKTINPYQLVRLSPDDLASQELALWREREAKHQLDMIKKSELELLNCSRQYVLKTHKGEQILEDNRPTDHIDNTEVITSLTDGSIVEKVDRKKDKDSDKKNYKHGRRDKEKKSSKDKMDKSHHRHRSSSGDHDRNRKRSRSRDKNSKHGDKRRSKSRDRHRRSSYKSSRHRKGSHRGSSTDKLDKKSKEILEQLVDNKIVPPLEDRLWKHVPQEDILPAPSVESDSDHEPTSTVSIPTPPRNNDFDELVGNQVAIEDKNDKFTSKSHPEVDNAIGSPVARTKSEEIWRGVINMIDVAQISITAHEVSGDCNGLALELPTNLDIVGRISPDTVWDYIGKMKCSNSKIISIVRLNAINIEEKMPYLALYSYLSSRNRLGVVKSTNKAVKDFYILPLASQKPIPQALLPLNGPGFEESRPALLLGIIVRDKRKRPYIDSHSPLITTAKKTKTELSLVHMTPPTRSYTPPPVKECRLKLPLPCSVDQDQDGDEPYSPEDSDPDSLTPSTTESVSNKSANFLESEIGPSQTFQPFVNKFDDIPGLENAPLPSSTQEIQRQMEKLNKEIEMQKSEINSISQNIATASTKIGSSALANIALPSNLQQILDSIKTIGTTPPTEPLDMKVSQGSNIVQDTSEFTIPLMLPTTFSRQVISSNEEKYSEDTIPLNLPNKKKVETDKSVSVLSSLSEEDLIRKAEEMLGNTRSSSKEDKATKSATSFGTVNNSQKLPKLELSQPPIPGLEDAKI